MINRIVEFFHWNKGQQDSIVYFSNINSVNSAQFFPGHPVPTCLWWLCAHQRGLSHSWRTTNTYQEIMSNTWELRLFYLMELLKISKTCFMLQMVLGKRNILLKLLWAKHIYMFKDRISYFAVLLQQIWPWTFMTFHSTTWKMLLSGGSHKHKHMYHFYVFITLNLTTLTIWTFWPKSLALRTL